MKLTKSSLSFLKATAVAAVALCAAFSTSSRAATITWQTTTTGSNTAWSFTGNWSGGVAPGATTGTTNTDIALFTSAPVSVGVSAHPITIDSNRNIGGITFDTGSGNFVIGQTTGPALLLTSG